MGTQTQAIQSCNTLSELFQLRVQKSSHETAYQYFDPTSKKWLNKTWEDIAEDSVVWQQLFKKFNIESGDKVAIMLKNCHEWVSFDQAALGLGLVTVPLFYNDSADNAAYILEESETKLLFIGDNTICKQIINGDTSLPLLRHIITLKELKIDDGRLHHLDNIWHIANDKLPEDTISDPNTLATIVYTSGTTGRPKGVMLSHKNILSNTKNILNCADFLNVSQSFLSFLPLSHMLERTGGYYFPIYIGATVSFARSIPQLAQDLQTIKPTVLVSVPRIYERIYAKIKEELAKKPSIVQSLFNLTVNVGTSHFEYKQGRGSWHPKFLLKPLLDKIVSKKLLDKFGGNIQFAICGGAALSQSVADLFIGIGLPLYQGYGMTECSPIAAVNRPNSNIPMSIGPALPGVQLKIAENDELQIKGDNVMLGYWKNEQATADTITKEGWLHTGDKARIDERGHAYIIGRLKEIIVMANGEKVPPVDMEMAILSDPLFEQVLIVGEGKPYLSALLVLNKEKHYTGNEKELLNRIKNLLSSFPGYAKIRKISLVDTPWTVENGLLTPTLKMKRERIIKSCAEVVDSMYEGHITT